MVFHMILYKVNTYVRVAQFYETEYKIFSDFGPVGTTKKWADYEQNFEAIFFRFCGRKKMLLKSYTISLLRFFFNSLQKNYFFLAKTRLNIHTQLCTYC